jgi:phosphopantothenoylcysteine decarboxylase/phosphopantothenate--cysteine ligase
VNVETTQQMLVAVLAECANADALIMAAAPADFRSATPAAQKIKKEGGVPRIELAANPDILQAVARQKAEKSFPKVTVGFAAESQDLLENARHKLQAKRLDLIAANDISTSDAGFGADTNRVTLLYADGHLESLPLMSKAEVAEAILEQVKDLLQ